MQIIPFSTLKPVDVCIHLIFAQSLLNGMPGYLAEETVSFIKQLAYCRALALGLEPSAEIRRWYGVISCCIQRANAKILRGEPVPGRHSPPPPRLIARGRDLALVGA